MKTDKAELIAELRRAIKTTARCHIYDRSGRWVPAVAIKKKTIRAIIRELEGRKSPKNQ